MLLLQWAFGTKLLIVVFLTCDGYCDFTWDLNDYIGSSLKECTLGAYNIFLTILLSTIVGFGILLDSQYIFLEFAC